MNKDELKKKLTSEQYHVTQEKGTEAPFSGKFVAHHEKGMYTCVVCRKPLFPSDTKFDSGTGWPSFDKAIPGAVSYVSDITHGANRTEITCTNCGAHLGHLFNDGPTATGKRFCVNSCSLDFKAESYELRLLILPLLMGVPVRGRDLNPPSAAADTSPPANRRAGFKKGGIKMNSITVKAMCIFRNGDRLLFSRGFDMVKKQEFLRSLGGHVEFGERGEETIRREMQEELGCGTEDVKFLSVIENLFTYNGKAGHEIVLVYEGKLADRTLYKKKSFTFMEGDRKTEAGWFSKEDIAKENLPLYPPFGYFT